MQWLRFKRNYVKKKKKKKQQQQEENTVLYEKWGKLKHTPHTHRLEWAVYTRKHVYAK